MTRTREIATDSSDGLLAFRVRDDDGILAEVMMTEAAADNPDKADKPDPVLEHFVELRKYIEHSHDGLSKRLEKVEAGQQKLEAGQQKLEAGQQKLEGRQEMVEGGLQRVERKVDAGFDRLARKIEALAPARRAAPRRRKP